MGPRAVASTAVALVAVSVLAVIVVLAMTNDSDLAKSGMAVSKPEPSTTKTLPGRTATTSLLYVENLGCLPPVGRSDHG